MYNEKVLPYVYRLTHKVTNEFYIGYREANKIKSSLDLPKYKTSSPIIRATFNDFNWEIIAEFFDGIDAYDFENELIKLNFNNKLCLNKHYRCGTISRFKSSRKSDRFKENHSKVIKESWHRYHNTIGNNNPMFGRSAITDNNLKWYNDGITSYFIKANTQPTHFINGRIFKARAKRSTAGISTGPHKQIKCTYCKKVGGARGMKRYHLENCKYKKEPL